MSKVEVSLSDIFTYVGIRQRPIKEGEAVFKAGNIILCQQDSIDSQKLFSLCLQTSALTSPPHEISIHLNSDPSKWSCICSCKAGQSGFCKHVIATLLYVNRHENLDLLSCTDVKKEWGEEKKEIQSMYYGAQRVSEFCRPVKKKARQSIQTTEDLDKKNFSLLMNCIDFIIISQ